MFKILKDFFKVKTEQEIKAENTFRHVKRCLRCCDRFGRVVFGPMDVRKTDGGYTIKGRAGVYTIDDVVDLYGLATSNIKKFF